MIQRAGAESRLNLLLRRFPVVGLLGARGSGKTTLARSLAAGWPEPVRFFDLEQAQDRREVGPEGIVLEALRGLVVLDEFQSRADLLPLLRRLADRARPPARFLLVSSAWPPRLREAVSVLGGRIGYLALEGLGLADVGNTSWPRLWLRGGHPGSWLAPEERGSLEWRRESLRRIVEQDVTALGLELPERALERCLEALARHHAEPWNGAVLARETGYAESTAGRYIQILHDLFLVRRLPPWPGDGVRRLVKTPRMYVTDSGMLHALLGIETAGALELHPGRTASFEGFALAEVIRRLGARHDECFLYASYGPARLALLVERGDHRVGFEFQPTARPEVTETMQLAREALGRPRIEVVHTGAETVRLQPGIRGLAIGRLLEDLEPLRDRR